MTSANKSKAKFFVNKKFFFHVKRSSAAYEAKSAELIKLFGGQIEHFLDHEVSYVLTDVPKYEWYHGADAILEKAIQYKVNLMSLKDLLIWCSKYIASQSSSDDDDETKAIIKQLQQPFIKFEDIDGKFAPSTKELIKWPELNLDINVPLGKSFFEVCVPPQNANNVCHPNNSAQLTQLAQSMKINTVRRRHSVYCEICNLKIEDSIENHIQNPKHIANIDKVDWNEVNSVIDSLPSLSTLNMRRLTNLTPPNGIEHQEFVCLHKMDSVSQLFFNSIHT